MGAIVDTSITDLLGNELTRDEREILSLYQNLKTLCARDDLPPCALLNLRQAMVMVWNACTDLDLVFEEPAVD